MVVVAVVVVVVVVKPVVENFTSRLEKGKMKIRCILPYYNERLAIFRHILLALVEFHAVSARRIRFTHNFNISNAFF